MKSMRAIKVAFSTDANAANASNLTPIVGQCYKFGVELDPRNGAEDTRRNIDQRIWAHAVRVSDKQAEIFEVIPGKSYTNTEGWYGVKLATNNSGLLHGEDPSCWIKYWACETPHEDVEDNGCEDWPGRNAVASYAAGSFPTMAPSAVTDGWQITPEVDTFLIVFYALGSSTKFQGWYYTESGIWVKTEITQPSSTDTVVALKNYAKSGRFAITGDQNDASVNVEAHFRG